MVARARISTGADPGWISQNTLGMPSTISFALGLRSAPIAIPPLPRPELPSKANEFPCSQDVLPSGGVKFGELSGIDCIGLDLGMRDHAHLLRIGDDDAIDTGFQDFGNSNCVTGRLDDNMIILGELPAGKLLERYPQHRDAPELSEAALL